MREGVHVFAAGRYPHHRTPQVTCGLRHDRELGMQTRLATEATTDLGRDHMDLGLVPSKRHGELGAQCVRHLRRGPHGDASIGGRCGGDTVHLDRGDRHALVHETAAHDHVGDGVEIDRYPVVHRHGLVRAMVGKDQLSPMAQGVLGVDVHGQRLDLGPDRLDGVLGLGRRLGEHDRDGVPHEPHPVGRQRRPGEIVVDLHEAVQRRNASLGRGPHGDYTGHVSGIVDVYGAHETVGDVGTSEGGKELVREIEVSHVRASTA